MKLRPQSCIIFPLWAWIIFHIFCDPLKLPFRPAPQPPLCGGVNPQLFGHCVLAVLRRVAAAAVLAHATTYLPCFIVGESPLPQEWFHCPAFFTNEALLRVRAWFKSVAMVGQSSKQKEEESEREGGTWTATAVNKSGPAGIRKVFKRPLARATSHYRVTESFQDLGSKSQLEQHRRGSLLLIDVGTSPCRQTGSLTFHISASLSTFSQFGHSVRRRGSQSVRQFDDLVSPPLRDKASWRLRPLFVHYDRSASTERDHP